MDKTLQTGEKIFFTNLILCIVSYIYFTILPLNEITLSIGYIFFIAYFGINFYVGNTSDLNILESLIVGTIGCAIGLFLLFFALYAEIIMKNSEVALWLTRPYFMPTMSLVKILFDDITIIYPILLIVINISLVLMGSITRKIMNKFKV